MGVITFDGRQSSAYGIVVEHFPDYTMPKPDYEIVHVPGKNGDIIIDKGSFQNIERKYEVALANDPLVTGAKKFHELITRLGEWLYPTVGYGKLSDDYDPTHFYMASFQNGLSIKNIENYGARATVSFNCKPFRYLNSGNTPIIFNSSGNLNNTFTIFSSKPLLKITKNAGDGTLNINGLSIVIKNYTGTLYVDTEIQDAYSESSSHVVTNRNSNIIAQYGFPQLIYGVNTIQFSSPITKVEVTPRWFTI